MIFLWPEMLLLLLGLPLAASLYALVLRNRKTQSLPYTHLLTGAEQESTAGRAARLVAPVLFLSSLACLLVAVARPSLAVQIASRYKTVVLAIDASISMRSDDVQPTRIRAVRELARHFVLELPKDVRVGIVSFAMDANEEQAPTQNRGAVLEALERFPLQNGTAIGSGILTALEMISPGGQATEHIGDRIPAHLRSQVAAREARKKSRALPAVGAVILLTDGDSNAGPSPLEAAEMAASRGVQVFTIGFGAVRPESGASDSVPDYIDEKTLQEIARITGANYFRAGSAPDLALVYQGLQEQAVIRQEQTEISAWFAAAGALLALCAVWPSMLRFNRIL